MSVCGGGASLAWRRGNVPSWDQPLGPLDFFDAPREMTYVLIAVLLCGKWARGGAGKKSNNRLAREGQQPG
jgi:hypothetical protein